jgi:hypothetical protein
MAGSFNFSSTQMAPFAFKESAPSARAHALPTNGGVPEIDAVGVLIERAQDSIVTGVTLANAVTNDGKVERRRMEAHIVVGTGRGSRRIKGRAGDPSKDRIERATQIAGLLLFLPADILTQNITRLFTRLASFSTCCEQKERNRIFCKGEK